jgi:hypothetical protein
VRDAETSKGENAETPKRRDAETAAVVGGANAEAGHQLIPTSRRRFLSMLGGFLSVLLLIGAVRGFKTDWLKWTATTYCNPAFLEGWAWSLGRLDLPHRPWDSAYVASRNEVYNVFPPMQSMLGYVGVRFARWSGNQIPFPEMHVFPLLVFGLPLPVVGYAVFRRRTQSALWGAVLTVGWLLGTAVCPCMDEARKDGVHHINHLLSQIGLLLLAGELLGRKRLWVALIGLAIAAWSRQLTIVYGLAVVAVSLPTLWSRSASPSGELRIGDCGLRIEREPRRRGMRLAALVAGLAVIVGVPAGLNWAKVGQPLSGGYELIYVGRDHALAHAARAAGLFSMKFLASDAYYMNAALPVKRGGDGRLSWEPSEYGTSMWIGTPLLAFGLLGVGAWWREPAARAMMLCTVPIIGALLLYHGTGMVQYGYWRFSLDFAPVWLVVAGPWLASGWRRWATVPCIAWSVAYFVMVDAWLPVVTG